MAKKNKKVIKNVTVNDNFINPVANLGLGMNNVLSGSTYVKNRITQDFNLLTTLYRTNWIVANIIDVVADDMTKAGIKIISKASPEYITRIKKCLKNKKVYSSVNEAVRWSRLYGGAGALMLIKGQENYLDQPLNIDSIMLNDFKGLLVFDRWSGIRPSAILENDIDSLDFGKPKYYEVTYDDGSTDKVHHSRILVFSGRALPRYEKQMELGWGVSEVETLYEELIKNDNTSYNAAQLVSLANLRVLQMGDLGEALAGLSQQAVKDLMSTLQAQAQIMSSFGMYIINKDDKFDTKQYTFAGLSDLLQFFMFNICGATKIPATKLYGRSPAGLNATGEGDEQNYYDMISNNQEVSLNDNYTKLLPVISMSENGFIPDDLEFEHESIETVNENEISDIVDKKSTAVISAYDTGAVTQKELRKELKQIGKPYNMFSNLDDNITNSSDDSLGPKIPDFNISGEDG